MIYVTDAAVAAARRQRTLLMRKLHMDESEVQHWEAELVSHLKEGVQQLQVDMADAEQHGHDHLYCRAEASMDALDGEDRSAHGAHLCHDKN
jgi:hypothetical protein